MNREQRRMIKSLKKDKLEAWINEYGVAMYNDGVRDAVLSIALKMHDEYGFGNRRIDNLLTLADTWLLGIHTEKDISADGIKATLVSEGITCLDKHNI